MSTDHTPTQTEQLLAQLEEVHANTASDDDALVILTAMGVLRRYARNAAGADHAPGETTVTLPAHDHDVECEDSNGREANSPAWEFKTPGVFRADMVTAYRDSVVLDGDVYDADSTELLNLERDALAILAAIRQHRVWAAEDEAADVSPDPEGAVATEDYEEVRSWSELADEFAGTAEQAHEAHRRHERDTGRADLFALGRCEGRSEAAARIRHLIPRLGPGTDLRCLRCGGKLWVEAPELEPAAEQKPSASSTSPTGSDARHDTTTEGTS